MYWNYSPCLIDWLTMLLQMENCLSSPTPSKRRIRSSIFMWKSSRRKIAVCRSTAAREEVAEGKGIFPVSVTVCFSLIFFYFTLFSDPRAQERIGALEQKLYKLQEELTEMHRRKGENAQQLIDLKNSLQEKERLLADRDRTWVVLTFLHFRLFFANFIC